jgi:hypothetical protein
MNLSHLRTCTLLEQGKLKLPAKAKEILMKRSIFRSPDLALQFQGDLEIGLTPDFHA